MEKGCTEKDYTETLQERYWHSIGGNSKLRYAALVVAACCLNAYTMFSGGTNLLGVLAWALECAVLVPIVWHPVASSLFALVVWLVLGAALPAIQVILRLPAGMWLPIGVLFFNLGTWTAAYPLLVTVTCSYLIVKNQNADTVSFFMAVAFLSLCALAGHGMHERHVAAQRHREDMLLRADREKMQRLLRDTQLARDMHDSLTNDLSAIMLTCDEQLAVVRRGEDRNVEQAWRFTRERAEDALHCAHDVIDVLRGSAVSRENSERMPLHALSDVLDDNSRQLEARGFHGEIIVQPQGALEREYCDSAESYQEIRSIIGEMFHNILWHADASEGYVIRIVVGSQFMRITEMNKKQANCADLQQNVHRKNQGRKAESGRGLGMHSRIIAQLGGQMRTSCEQDIWTLFVSIPLTQPL